MTTTLFLVRHASHDRLGRVLCGRMPGVGLSRDGRAEALRLAERLQGEAVAAVYAKHLARKQFVELQSLVAERDRLEMDWGRLQLERSTQGSHARVEQLARERMGMRTPEPAEIRMVSP